MQGTSKTMSTLLMAICAGAAIAQGTEAKSIVLGSPHRVRRAFGGGIQTMRGWARGSAPTGAPVGTFWVGDGVRPIGKSRQVRRAEQLAERKQEDRRRNR